AYFARCPAPPLSGLLLAGLTPPIVEVEILHEMVRPIDYDTDADFIALSFMDFCAPHAYRVAARFRRLGKTVIAGGRYPSTFPEAVLPHVDAVVVGEAELVWPRVVEDLVAGRLRRRYDAPFAPSLENIPPPRYDLAEPVFATPVVTEATRGCPFRCTYCQLNIRPAAFRCRPIADVIGDLTATTRLPFHKRKLAMFYDNNFGGDMDYAKELLREVAKLDFWAVGFQFSFNCLKDDEFVELLAGARGAMAFIGLESLNQPSLYAVHKRQNKVQEYRDQFRKLKERGIMTFTGMMLALDGDTPEYYRALPQRLEAVDPSAVLLSISIPIPGTPFHRQVEAEGRILDRDLAHYEGDHLVFQPATVSPADVFDAYERINRIFYSWGGIVRRWWRLVWPYVRRGRGLARFPRALLLSYVFLKVSVFERDHALQKVFEVTRLNRRRFVRPAA
ncbi:MAG: B12-binding domain-containing radical SAM protein, partial [Burkholderiales bacterium]